jgi:hypothetical protein
MVFIWAVIIYAGVLTLTLLKQYLKFYAIQQTISKFDLFQLCTDSSVTDQEAIVLRKVNPDTHEPATVFASIKCLKRNRTSRILSRQVTFFLITWPGTSTTFPYFNTPALGQTKSGLIRQVTSQNRFSS